MSDTAMGWLGDFDHPIPLILVQEPFFRVWMASILHVAQVQGVGAGHGLTNGSSPFLWPQGLVRKEHMTETGQIRSSLGVGTGTLGEKAHTPGSRIL